MRFVDSLDIHASNEARMSPALNGSSAIRCFKHSNAIEIRNGITFDFYTGLPHIYICHTLIAWVRFLWSRPQTTSHVVLVRRGGDRRVKKIVREPKWSRSSPSVIVLESENGNKGTLHQKRVRQRRKSLTD